MKSSLMNSSTNRSRSASWGGRMSRRSVITAPGSSSVTRPSCPIGTPCQTGAMPDPARPRDLIGDPLWAVLIPPRLARFRRLAGLGDAALTTDLTGFNKYVLLAGERVFLFPREQENVAWFEHELAVGQALTAGGFDLAPRVRHRWQDQDIYPYPFAEVTRLTGTRPADPAALFGSLGRVLARIHQVRPPELAGPRLIEWLRRPEHRWLGRALDPVTSGDAAAEAGQRL